MDGLHTDSSECRSSSWSDICPRKSKMLSWQTKRKMPRRGDNIPVPDRRLTDASACEMIKRNGHSIFFPEQLIDQWVVLFIGFDFNPQTYPAMEQGSHSAYVTKVMYLDKKWTSFVRPKTQGWTWSYLSAKILLRDTGPSSSGTQTHTFTHQWSIHQEQLVFGILLMETRSVEQDRTTCCSRSDTNVLHYALLSINFVLIWH